jgi:23S rRNA (cytosine1962-C5)-methyltransferase
MKSIRLKPGKEKSLLRGHPWVFDGAVAKGGGEPGETVRVDSADGQFLAWAALSPQSRIRARVWSFDQAQRIDDAFVRDRLQAAVALRSQWRIPSSGVRLVHAESDGLPGLIVDRYGDTLVAQFGSTGAERFKDAIADALLDITGCDRLYERSDTSSRALEGLPEATGWLRGSGPTELTLTEHHWKLGLDIAQGHKTGFYLDQRDSRLACHQWVQQVGAASVLNCFSYTGGFTVAALHAGAQEVTSIDSSGPALARLQANVALNGFDAVRAPVMDADVNKSLRAFVAEGRRFDAIVLDPPKLAPTVVHAERAARAYKDLNRLGLQLLNPGGVLLTFSCSGGIGVELFQKIVASAGTDAGVDGAIVGRLGGACDHPMTLRFPEGEYLKGLIVVKKG